MTRDVTLSPFSLPLATPLETAIGAIEARRGFLLVVDGAYGEATPLEGWTESYADCRSCLNAATTLLESGASWNAALEACAGNPAARHAIDVARLDAAAKQRGKPLAAVVAEADPDAYVAVNATIGEAPPRETAAHARRAVTSGYECLKLKVGRRPVAGDVERVRAVRAEVGPDVELRVDANGTWTMDQAREAMDAFDDLDVTYAEQPLPADDIHALADLRQHTPIGVAVDETLAHHDVGDVLMTGAADVVVLKPMALGGLEPALRAAIRARELDVRPVLTTTIDAVVARTAALHLAAGLGGLPACGLATADRLRDDLAVDPAPVTSGRMFVPSGPGLGVETPEVPR